MAESAADIADMVDQASLGAVVAPQDAATPEPPPVDDPAEAAAVDSTIAEPDVAPQPTLAKPQGESVACGTASARARRDLPSYTRSLLKISVPVTVTLAEKRQPLGRIVELSPGTIIQFDKSCEEMLDLSVAGHKIAAGEAVKVGEKFGLKITSIVLPEERFEAVRPKRNS